jgi:hypothetical protein
MIQNHKIFIIKCFFENIYFELSELHTFYRENFIQN